MRCFRCARATSTATALGNRFKRGFLSFNSQPHVTQRRLSNSDDGPHVDVGQSRRFNVDTHVIRLPLSQPLRAYQGANRR